jgi:hypothetical protein
MDFSGMLGIGAAAVQDRLCRPGCAAAGTELNGAALVQYTARGCFLRAFVLQCRHERLHIL